MLNKLSFNIFNELNESETEKYKIKKKVLIESNGVKTINESLNNEDLSKEQKIANLKMMDRVVRKFNNEDLLEPWLSYGVPDEATEDDYSDIATETEDGLRYEDMEKLFKELLHNALEDNLYKADSDELAFAKKYEPNIKNINESANNEERLASLKMQLEKDGDQLADDEKEAIEKEIEELEKEVINESSNPEADEKVGGDYNEFIEELQNFRQLMVDQVEAQSTKLASQIIMDTVEEYDDIIRNYERQKNIEIEGAMNESSLKEEYSEKYGGDPKDFIGDLISVKNQLSKLNLDAFGSHLAQQMVEDFIETIDYQINKAKRLMSGDEFYSESEEGCSKQKINEDEYGDNPIKTNDKYQLYKSMKGTDIDGVTYSSYLVRDNNGNGVRSFIAKNDIEAEKKFNESSIEEAEEMKVKNLQVIKEQGNVYMLEDENKKMIVGENYNANEGIIENAEIYENKNEADKDYLNRCGIKKNGKNQNK